MRKLRLSGNARAFLQREARYLRDRSPSAAEAFVNRMREARRNLSKFPEIGLRNEAVPIEGAMRLIVGDYILDYELAADDIAITAIRHARQLDPNLGREDDFDYEAEADVSPEHSRKP